MRTKTLLLTAAIIAAGAAASMAQSNVYSLNVVGYVNVTVKPGFNMLVNPLDDGAGNLLANIVATTEDGCTVFPWVSTAGHGAYGAADNYIDGIGWSGSTVIAPGNGFWFQVPAVAFGGTVTNITFVGTVVQGTTTNHLDTAFTLAGSKAPVAKQLGYPVADGDSSTTTWHYPAGDGDTVFTFTAGTGAGTGYTSYNYILGLGWDDVTGLGPNIGVAQGFFSQKVSAPAADWVETFVVQ